MTKTKSLLEVLQSTTAYFTRHEIENPRLNAEQLLAHTLRLSRMDLYLEFERNLAENELGPLRDLVKRRGQGEPLQHLLGTVEFCGHTFAIDKRAMVPRPETEELVELLKSEVSLRPGGAYAPVGGQRSGGAGQQRISMQDRHLLAREVLHDPEVALFGGPGGDELVRKLIEQAPAHLEPGGLLALEIGLGQAEGLSDFLRQKNYHDIQLKKDYSGISRFLLARYG